MNEEKNNWTENNQQNNNYNQNSNNYQQQNYAQQNSSRQTYPQQNNNQINYPQQNNQYNQSNQVIQEDKRIKKKNIINLLIYGIVTTITIALILIAINYITKDREEMIIEEREMTDEEFEEVIGMAINKIINRSVSELTKEGISEEQSYNILRNQLFIKDIYPEMPPEDILYVSLASQLSPREKKEQNISLPKSYVSNLRIIGNLELIPNPEFEVFVENISQNDLELREHLLSYEHALDKNFEEKYSMSFMEYYLGACILGFFHEMPLNISKFVHEQNLNVNLSYLVYNSEGQIIPQISITDEWNIKHYYVGEDFEFYAITIIPREYSEGRYVIEYYVNDLISNEIQTFVYPIFCSKQIILQDIYSQHYDPYLLILNNSRKLMLEFVGFFEDEFIDTFAEYNLVFVDLEKNLTIEAKNNFINNVYTKTEEPLFVEIEIGIPEEIRIPGDYIMYIEGTAFPTKNKIFNSKIIRVVS